MFVCLFVCLFLLLHPSVCLSDHLWHVDGCKTVSWTVYVSLNAETTLPTRGPEAIVQTVPVTRLTRFSPNLYHWLSCMISVTGFLFNKKMFPDLTKHNNNNRFKPRSNVHLSLQHMHVSAQLVLPFPLPANL